MTRRILTAAALALMPLAGAAQTETAIIQGKLLDAQGQPVVGYPVILENQTSMEKGYSANIGLTSETGEFSVSVDRPGTYTTMVPNAAGGLAQCQIPPELFATPTDMAAPTHDIGTITLPAEAYSAGGTR